MIKKKLEKKLAGCMVLIMSGMIALTGCNSTAKSQESTVTESIQESSESKSADTSVASEVSVNKSSDESAQNSITDFAGTVFDTSQDVSSVSCIHPIFTMLAIRLAPEKVKSVDKVFTTQYMGNSNQEKLLTAFDPAAIGKLPVTNTFFQGIDAEQMLELKPDYIVTLDKDPKAAELSEKTGIPLIILSKNSLDDYATSIRDIGAILGQTEEADKMADLWENQIAEVSAKTQAIAPEDMPDVYFCGNGGANTTVGSSTIMSSAVKIAGGHNLGDDISTNDNATNESIEISMEQILQWNPDIIIANSTEEYNEITTGSEWADLDAVKNGKVYCQTKFSFVDGLTAVPGVLWCYRMFNDADDEDLKQETYKKDKEFFKLFFKYDMTDEELEILR